MALVPSRKVTAGAAVAGLMSIILLVLSRMGIELSANEGVGLTGFLTFVFQYFVPDKESTDETPTATV